MLPVRIMTFSLITSPLATLTTLQTLPHYPSSYKSIALKFFRLQQLTKSFPIVAGKAASRQQFWNQSFIIHVLFLFISIKKYKV